MTRLFKALRKSRTNRGPEAKRQFRFEHLEDRRVMMASGVVSGPVNNGSIKLAPPNDIGTPSSVGSISVNNTGVISITGADVYSDNVQVSIDSANGNVKVTLTNMGTPIIKEFAKSAAQSILFYGLGGDDTFNNLTSLPSIAYGGAGNDTFFGGSGPDTFFGGDGKDYFDGRAGNDVLNGDAGDDLIFGDAGSDALHGGDGIDQLYGGQDNDNLYGENGSDHLDGGTGTNKMYGGPGADQFYDFSLPTTAKAQIQFAQTTDFNPAEGDTNSTSFDAAFGWFDAKSSDVGVRSLARFDSLDGSISRADMLGLYIQVETDGKVSAEERADLLAISDIHSGLNMTDDVRSLSSNVVGDTPANFHYQGKSLGILQNGDAAAKLKNLVNKWFYGQDLPAIDSHSQYQWVGGNLFVNGPSNTDVAQGAAGDCYYMSVLAELAFQQPNDVKNMFVDNGDGTFAVQFFENGTAQFVTVNQDLPAKSDGTAEYASFGGTYVLPGNELWVALAEKAYAQINEEGWLGQDGKNSYAGIDGGHSAVAMSQITGNNAQSIQFGRDVRFQDIADDFSSFANLITFDTKTSGVADNIVPDHTYAMIGFNAAKQTIQLYNPWGLNASKPGIITLKWSEVQANFNDFNLGVAKLS